MRRVRERTRMERITDLLPIEPPSIGGNPFYDGLFDIDYYWLAQRDAERQEREEADE